MLELEEHQIYCPYCGEIIEVLVDTSELESNYIEDCQVCCRPIDIHVSVDEFEQVTVSARHENE